jgi:hypothetical protein
VGPPPLTLPTVLPTYILSQGGRNKEFGKKRKMRYTIAESARMQEKW